MLADSKINNSVIFQMHIQTFWKHGQCRGMWGSWYYHEIKVIDFVTVVHAVILMRHTHTHTCKWTETSKENPTGNISRFFYSVMYENHQFVTNGTEIIDLCCSDHIYWLKIFWSQVHLKTEWKIVWLYWTGYFKWYSYLSGT